jgi:hypothetical protein
MFVVMALAIDASIMRNSEEFTTNLPLFRWSYSPETKIIQL